MSINSFKSAGFRAFIGAILLTEIIVCIIASKPIVLVVGLSTTIIFIWLMHVVENKNNNTLKEALKLEDTEECYDAIKIIKDSKVFSKLQLLLENFYVLDDYTPEAIQDMCNELNDMYAFFNLKQVEELYRLAKTLPYTTSLNDLKELDIKAQFVFEYLIILEKFMQSEKYQEFLANCKKKLEQKQNAKGFPMLNAVRSLPYENVIELSEDLLNKVKECMDEMKMLQVRIKVFNAMRGYYGDIPVKPLEILDFSFGVKKEKCGSYLIDFAQIIEDAKKIGLKFAYTLLDRPFTEEDFTYQFDVISDISKVFITELDKLKQLTSDTDDLKALKFDETAKSISVTMGLFIKQVSVAKKTDELAIKILDENPLETYKNFRLDVENDMNLLDAQIFLTQKLKKEYDKIAKIVEE